MQTARGATRAAEAPLASLHQAQQQDTLALGRLHCPGKSHPCTANSAAPAPGTHHRPPHSEGAQTTKALPSAGMPMSASYPPHRPAKGPQGRNLSTDLS